MTNEQQLIADMNERRDLFKALLSLGGVHIGSSAYTRVDTDPNIDLDIAITDSIIYSYIESCTNSYGIVHRARNNKSTKYYGNSDTNVFYKSIRGDTINCDYSANEHTLWTAVNKIQWSSGISMDLLFYKEEHLESVNQTMNMLLANKSIWTKDTKPIRVKLFEATINILNLNK